MTEQLNNRSKSQTADTAADVSAVSREKTAEATADKMKEIEFSDNSEIAEFVKKERESFDARYAEIKGLVNTLGGFDTSASSEKTKEDSAGAIVLSIVPTAEEKKENANNQSVKSAPSVPVNATRYATVEKVHPVNKPYDTGLKHGIGDKGYAKPEGGELDDFHEEKIYPEPDYADYTDEYVPAPKLSIGEGELLKPTIDSARGADSDFERDQYALDEYNQGYRYETIDIFARAELSKRINGFYKEQSALLRRIAKLESRQKNADVEENISIVVEKIGVMKELCELTIEILASCVYIEAKGKCTRFKRVLKSDIDKYNAFCDEYETASGRALERLDYGMIDDIMAGKICSPIPTVYYYGNEDNAVYDRHDEDYDRTRRLEEEEELLDREYRRYLDGGIPLNLSDAEKKALARKRTEKLSAIKRATERDVLLVGLRSEYALSVLEAKRDILVRSYGLDKRKMLGSIRTIERKIEKIKRRTGRAVKLERENNSRYYLLPAIDPETEKLKKGARRERLDALRSRLDVLLAEREGVNDRLIALYGGSDKGLKKSKISRKAANVRRKSATAIYKRQSKIAKRIDRYRVPAYMKERAYELLNQKTQAVATAEECHYKLRRLKPVGRAKRELVLEIRRAKATVKRVDKDIRYMLRKLRRNQERYEDHKEWAAVIAFVLFVSLLGIAAWFFIGDDIIMYFKKLAEQLRGG